MLLNHVKGLMFGLPEHYKALGHSYLAFGKIELSKGETQAFREALKLMNEVMNIFKKGLSVAQGRKVMVELETLRFKTLRSISAAYL